MYKLNWGSGPDVHPDWVNVDIDDYPNVEISDIRDGLPYPDGYFDLVVANHSLSMLTYEEIVPALTELCRVTKNGGVIRVIERDLLRAIEAYETGDADWFPIGNDVEMTMGGKLCAYVVWYSSARLVFTASWLAELLNRAGFDPAVSSYGLTQFGSSEICELDSRRNESLIVEGKKRETA